MHRMLWGFALLVACAATVRAGETVYASNFTPERAPAFASTKPIAAKTTASWSVASLEKSPAGDRLFLGSFIDDDVRLTLEKLPPHTFVRVSFDLAILLSWDGSGVESPPGSVVGPDFWRLGVVGGPTLLWHTFSNVPDDPGYADECKVQSFPSPVAGDRASAMTGALLQNKLGYIFGRTMRTPMDSVYRISITFPHAADAIAFTFAGGGLQPIMDGVNDESWGLDNLLVETFAQGEIARAGAESAKKLLARAAAPGDAVAANEAFGALLTCDAEGRTALREHIGIDDAERRKLAAMVEQLDDADPARRARAAEELRKMGPAIEWWLWPIVDGHDSPEVRGQAAGVLRALVVAPPLKDEPSRAAAVAARALHLMGERP